MYPYRNRWRWFIFGRYAHLSKAINERRGGLQDSLLEARVASLRTWNFVRFCVFVLLSFGLVAAASAWVGRRLPAFEPAFEVLGAVAAISSTFAGVLTLAYLGLTRLLGQIEADILAILTVGRNK